VTTITKADDKRRLTIPGVEQGQRYLIKQESGGWWIQPVPEVKRKREWTGPRRDLFDHLQEMADAGLKLDPMKTKVPPCPF
jgi:hypothetical protein